MKRLLCFLLLLNTAIGQVPNVHYTDFGFSKPVKEFTLMKYKFEDKFVEDSYKELMKFNEDGNVNYREFQIFGPYASLTTYAYEYESGQLVSMKKTVPSATMFNETTTYSYSDDGLLTHIHIVSKAYESDYVVTHNTDGQIAKLEGRHHNGNSVEEFIYLNKLLTETIHTNYTSNNTVITKKFFQENQPVLIYNSSELYLTLYLEGDEESSEIQLNYPAEELEMQYEHWKQLLDQGTEKPALLKLVKETTNHSVVSYQKYKRNEQNDWISSFTQENIFFFQEYWSFREIIYRDGTSSGSFDFNILDVNELKRE